MLPFLKRLLLPLAAICFICILLSKSSTAPDLRYPTRLPKTQEPIRIPIAHSFSNISSHNNPAPGSIPEIKLGKPSPDYTIPVVPSNVKKTTPKALLDLTTCPLPPNRFTGHIRLPNMLFNISMDPPSAKTEEKRTFWNPTIVALPYWADNQYIIVSMVVASGEAYRRNVLCEAIICHPKNKRSTTTRERVCTEGDLRILGPNGGLRCATAPIEVDVPPTPAERCSGLEQTLADIPGFHDPRLFYSGRGEPILMVVSQYCSWLQVAHNHTDDLQVKIRLHWSLDNRSSGCLSRNRGNLLLLPSSSRSWSPYILSNIDRAHSKPALNTTVIRKELGHVLPIARYILSAVRTKLNN